jgi:hypothetical protein
MKPIRKGANPVKIPFQIKSTDPTLAAWCNEVRTAIRQLEARLPTFAPQRPMGGGGAALQFKVYGVRYDSDAEAWKCKVRPGYVRTISPDADATEPVKDWMPTVGSGPAVPLDADTAPEITIANGQTIYCRVATTAKGIIEAAPKIEAAATPEAGVHFQPPDESIEGDLYFPIADIEIAGDPEVVTVTQIQQGGPIVVVPNLPELKNIGGEREVFAGRAAAGDTYDLRTLEQLAGSGEPILRPLGESEEEGDTIPFRRVAGKPSQAQITVSGDDPDIIVIEGNGFEQNFEGIVKNLNVIDGLVTSYEEVSEGWWGTRTFRHEDYVGASTRTMVETWEGGILVGLTHSSGYISGDGTQDEPGVIEWVTADVDT